MRAALGVVKEPSFSLLSSRSGSVVASADDLARFVVGSSGFIATQTSSAQSAMCLLTIETGELVIDRSPNASARQRGAKVREGRVFRDDGDAVWIDLAIWFPSAGCRRVNLGPSICRDLGKAHST